METILSGFSINFSSLINHTIDISIFICLIFIIKIIISKRLPAWWHYSLWLLLLIRMTIPSWTYERNDEVSKIIPFPVNMDILDTMILDKNNIVYGIATNASSKMTGFNMSFDEMFFFIWIVGALLFGYYYLVKNIEFWLAIKEKPMTIDKDILELMEECKKRMKINIFIGIIITDKVKSPTLFGYIRPRLLLPEGVFEKLTRSELTYVFMHELGHLKRHDIGVSWVITLLQVFQWFNPFVWLAFYQMRIDQESACDASVLKRLELNQSKDYAASLLGFLEKFCQNRQVSAMAGIMENKSQIKKRIAMILKYRGYSKKITITSIVMLFITGYIFFTLTGYGCATRNIVMLNDEFTDFDRKTWKEAEGSISVDGGILTIDSQGNKKGYIRYPLTSSKWQYIELRARVDMVYGTFVGDIVANPGSIYFNTRGAFCIWEDRQMMLATGDLKWHTWKIVQTGIGVDIYLDGKFMITNTKFDPTEIILGNELADQEHGVRVSYDWIKVRYL